MAHLHKLAAIKHCYLYFLNVLPWVLQYLDCSSANTKFSNAFIVSRWNGEKQNCAKRDRIVEGMNNVQQLRGQKSRSWHKLACKSNVQSQRTCVSNRMRIHYWKCLREPVHLWYNWYRSRKPKVVRVCRFAGKPTQTKNQHKSKTQT